ncbi:hypothetical protein [Streptomyces cathayae]|uniref:Uncharacterized protein n=1 Tax=Streptomyces cathayae TaxID=3031124 RepID=A0ABY8JTK7_9ACTN|nr:hypothetical protein [Streptomyces sp. HUAS 5]WGD38718.1 hypothetical protein PYS65_00155 [Streptomyces sp. HUAS 5]WGD44727.1 hypothetical protein PYS65_33955 [Streptomyces sp. HUAS 5]WGD45227.1 hypothetical protein PYS65_34670 [Streptomyces sp. HUAS 5]
MTTAPVCGARTPIAWWECEPRRLRRDREEIPAHFPDLVFSDEGAGSWEGTLPRWPFGRPEPTHLTDWIGESGLRLRLAYSQAYPMVAPRIIPLDPLPAPFEWTQHIWHVNGDASLCLLQDDVWTGRETVVDLLLKAAGWRIEYALMKYQAIEEMTGSGIVTDHRLDHFLAQPPPPGDGGQDGPAC